MERFLNPRLVFGLVVALYLLAFPYHPLLRSPNELCRLWQTRALVDHGKISINETIFHPGHYRVAIAQTMAQLPAVTTAATGFPSLSKVCATAKPMASR